MSKPYGKAKAERNFTINVTIDGDADKIYDALIYATFGTDNNFALNEGVKQIGDSNIYALTFKNTEVCYATCEIEDGSFAYEYGDECGVHHVMDIVDIEFDEPYDEPVFSNESSYQYDIDYFTKEINAVLKEHGLDYKVSKIEYVGATEFVVEDVNTFELEEDSLFDCMPDCYDAPDWTW